MISSQVGGHLAVVGGGGFPYPGGEDTAEVLTEAQEWRAFRYPGVDRAFGVGIQVKPCKVSQFVDSSTQVPASVTENCEMEPNYGSHEYFRKQHEERLQGKVRLGYHSDTEEESNVDIDVVRCTGVVLPRRQAAAAPGHPAGGGGD